MALEVTLAAVTGFFAFAVTAVTLMVVGDGVASVAVAVVCLAAVVVIAWLWGIVYAAPAAITSLLAFDWFAFPPTHAHAFPGGADLAELFAYVGVAVLIGELAAHAARRRAGLGGGEGRVAAGAGGSAARRHEGRARRAT